MRTTLPSRTDRALDPSRQRRGPRYGDRRTLVRGPIDEGAGTIDYRPHCTVLTQRVYLPAVVLVGWLRLRAPLRDERPGPLRRLRTGVGRASVQIALRGRQPVSQLSLRDERNTDRYRFGACRDMGRVNEQASRGAGVNSRRRPARRHHNRRSSNCTVRSSCFSVRALRPEVGPRAG